MSQLWALPRPPQLPLLLLHCWKDNNGYCYCCYCWRSQLLYNLDYSLANQVGTANWVTDWLTDWLITRLTNQVTKSLVLASRYSLVPADICYGNYYLLGPFLHILHATYYFIPPLAVTPRCFSRAYCLWLITSRVLLTYWLLPTVLYTDYHYVNSTKPPLVEEKKQLKRKRWNIKNPMTMTPNMFFFCGLPQNKHYHDSAHGSIININI